MNKREKQIERLLSEGAARLIARVQDRYSVDAECLVQRIKAVINKYLLADDPATPDESIREFIDGLQAEDLCLIVACERGDPLAWNDLIARFSATVRSAARAASSNEHGAEDLAQSIWAELHGLRLREDGKPAGKLGYYSGRGSLAGWLRAVVAQLAVDQHRKQAKLVQTEEDTDFDSLPRSSSEEAFPFQAAEAINPEDLLSESLTANDLKLALAKSIARLAEEDRLLVKLYYFDGLRLREAGAVLGVHEATASRRLSKIHSQLRKEVENLLVQERNWTPAETKRAFADIALHLQVDLESLLTAEKSATKMQP